MSLYFLTPHTGLILLPATSSLFPNIKRMLKASHFVSTEEVKAKMTELLKHSYRKLSAPLLCTVAAPRAAVVKPRRELLLGRTRMIF